MDIVGEVERIYETHEISIRFRKREFILHIDGKYPELIKFQAVQDFCESLDSLCVGDRIKVFFNLKGKFWTSKEGKEIHFNSLQCWKFEFVDQYNKVTEGDYSHEDDDEDLPF